MSTPVATNSRPKRRWLTFSLRTLLIGATLVSLLLAYFANILIRVRRLQSIRREIEATGAEAYFDHEVVGGSNEIDEPPPGPAIVRWICGNYAFDHIRCLTSPSFNLWNVSSCTALQSATKVLNGLSGSSICESCG